MNKDVQGLIYGSCLLSIATSIYLFVTGKRDAGIFVGLWAPTILGLGTFFNTEMHMAQSKLEEPKAE